MLNWMKRHELLVTIMAAIAGAILGNLAREAAIVAKGLL